MTVTTSVVNQGSTLQGCQCPLLPVCCGECCLGEFMSGGSSEKETDFSNETDLSAMNTSYMHINDMLSVINLCMQKHVE